MCICLMTYALTQLGLMGTTVVGITGDNGVASNKYNYCLSADGNPVPGNGRFLPVDPATCPFVTALGATEIKAGKKVRAAFGTTLSLRR